MEAGTWAELASELVEAVAGDAIAGSREWGPWDEEKTSLHRLLATSKRMAALAWPWDLLRLLAPGYPPLSSLSLPPQRRALAAQPAGALWEALPLLKARLGSLLVELESTVDKRRRLPRPLLALLHDWLALALHVRLLPLPNSSPFPPAS